VRRRCYSFAENQALFFRRRSASASSARILATFALRGSALEAKVRFDKPARALRSSTVMELSIAFGSAKPVVQRRLAHLLRAGAGTELAEPRRLLWIPTFVFPQDRVASAAEALVKHLVSSFVISGFPEFSGSYLFIRKVNHVG
jgi:hypothetical protein